MPKPWYEGYLTVVRKDMILLKDVMMTGNGRISRGDLRRLSALERVEWVWNAGGRANEDVVPGGWVLYSERARGERLGRILEVEYPELEGGDDELRCRVQFENGVEEMVGLDDVRDGLSRLASSGYAQTKGWGTATSGVRQLRRMDKKLERRAVAKNPRRERWLARQEGEEEEDSSGEGDAG